MNKGLAFALGLILGGAGGGLLVNMMLKQQFEQKADEEIAACRNAFLEELEKRRKESGEKAHEEKKEAAVEAVKTYSPEPEKAAKIIERADEEKKRPYIISPDVFDDEQNPYKRAELMLLSDSTVIKDGKAIDLEEIDTFVGREALTHFGEYEEDRVCVRNEMLGIDYEIIMVNETYEDYKKNHPASGK